MGAVRPRPPARQSFPLGPGGPLLIQVQDLLGDDVHRGGRDGAPRGARVHKHLGDVVAEVDLAVGCDGLVLH